MLSESEAAQIKVYVDDCLPILQLSIWDVRVIQEAPNEGADATILPVENRYYANLRVSDGIWGYTPAKIREIITHELLHLPMNRIERHVDIARNQLGQGAYDLLSDAVIAEVEMIVDWLSRHVAQVLPLPDFGEVPEAEGPRDYFKKARHEPKREKAS
jgi:hypothetical protein